jgi:hypothetical protein
MAGFLLWNVDRKPLDGFVQNLVRQHNIDVVLLVEYAFGTSLLPGMLMADGLFKRPSPSKFGVFVRQNQKLIRVRYRLGKRVGIWRWIPPSGEEGLLVLLHGLDRRNYDDSSRRVFFHSVADAVQRCEKDHRHRRTIIAGDFNAHPFESAVVDSDGLHAIGVHSVKSRNARKVVGLGLQQEFFYKVMAKCKCNRAKK